jgi:hypothetical protein
MIAAYLLDPRRRGYPLDEIAVDAGLSARAEGADEDATAAAREADLVRQLAPLQAAAMEDEGLTPLYRDIEMPLIGVLAGMENVGVAIDLPRLAEIRARIRAEIDDLTGRIYALAGTEFTIVCANNDEMALGAILALKAAGKTLGVDGVLVGGVDATADALASLEAGELATTVFQDASGQGGGGVNAAIMLINGETVEDYVDIPYQLVTLDNIADFK